MFDYLAGQATCPTVGGLSGTPLVRLEDPALHAGGSRPLRPPRDELELARVAVDLERGRAHSWVTILL